MRGRRKGWPRAGEEVARAGSGARRTRPPAASRAVDPDRLFERLASVVADDLVPALDEVAERIRELFPADVAAVVLSDETDPDGLTVGFGVGPSPAAQAIGPLLAPGDADPFVIGVEAIRLGRPMEWPRIVAEGAATDGLARLAKRGRPAGAIMRLLSEAGAVAVPLTTARHPCLGAVVLVALTPESALPESAAAELAALAPAISLAARSHQLTWRSRRARQLLEGVVASTPTGILVSDAKGRLTLANAAAERIFGIDLAPHVGQPMSDVVTDRLKWRVRNPSEFEARMLAVHADERRVDEGELETLDGRTVEHFTAPVRDAHGGLAGRFEVLSDVTATRQAIAVERRLTAERTLLLEREERRAQEEVALSRAAHMMASALTRADIHEHLLQQAQALAPACEKAAVLVLDARGDALPAATRGFSEEVVGRMVFRAGEGVVGRVLASRRPAATRGFSEEVVGRMVFRAGEGVVGRVLASRRPFICNDTERDARISSRITRPEGIRSFMHVPLVLGERAYGLLSVNATTPRAFGERELRVLNELARHAASALQNALQFEQERHIAETLQQALLAEEAPQVPGLTLATLYQAAAGSQVGGDFHNAWTLPDGRVALLVGDVSGKGIEAAGITAMVRYMAEALAQHHCRPGELVRELNALMCPRVEDGRLVTLFLAMIDPLDGTLQWCSAGHPPPVLLHADGTTDALEDPDLPCGVFPDAAYRTHDAELPPGALVFVYTDGLIEARRDDQGFGEERLRAAIVAHADEEPRRLTRSVYAAVRAWCGGRIADDVAVAVVRRDGAPEALTAGAAPPLAASAPA